MVNKDTVRLIALANKLMGLMSGGIKDLDTATEENYRSAVFYDRRRPHPYDKDCYQVVLDMVVMSDPNHPWHTIRTPLLYAESPDGVEYKVYAVLCKDEEESFLLIEFPPLDFAITITKDEWFITEGEEE